MALPHLVPVTSPDSFPQGGAELERHLTVVRDRPPEPPQTSGGLFLVKHGLLQPEDLDVHVTDVKDYRKAQVDDLAMTLRQEVELSTGFYHRANTTIPHRRRTKMMIEFATPWICSDQGLFTYLGRKAAQLGIASRIISGERIHVGLPIAPNIYRAFEHSWNNITLPRSALAGLRIMSALDEGLSHHVHVGKSFVVGASRTAMFEPASQILAPDNNRTLYWSEAVDPGVHDQIDFLHPDLSLDKVQAEAAAIKASGGRFLKGSLGKHLRHTLDLSLDHAIPQAATSRTLLSGVGGKLAELTPEGQQRLVTLYLLSIVFNEGYAEANDGLDGTQVLHVEGAHLSITDMWNMLEGRFNILIDELEHNDDDPEDIDYERVHAFAAAQAVKATQEAA